MSLEREALRYLGCRGAPDEGALEQVRRTLADARTALRFKSVARECALTVTSVGIALDGLEIVSASLAARFRGADTAVALAGTLGLAADALIRRHAALGAAGGAVAHAVCTALLEQELDELTDEIARAHPGCSLTPRFSPGYGDFDLRYQADVLRLLDAGRRLGITLNEAYMMTPLKTVTALVALMPGGSAAGVRGCAGCEKRDCAFREDT